MILETIPELAKLSTNEKLQLASELWEENIEKISSEESEKVFQDLLKARLEEYESNPESLTSLEDLRMRAGLGS